MPKPESRDEQVARKAADFAVQIRAAAAAAATEEEIRIAVEKQLAFVEQEVGVKLEGRHEFTLAKGPRFEASNAAHNNIVKIAQRCHTATSRDERSTLAGLEEDLDELARQLWEITRSDMKAIREALVDLGFGVERSSLDEDDE